jgi:hypothetical protein
MLSTGFLALAARIPNMLAEKPTFHIRHHALAKDVQTDQCATENDERNVLSICIL